MNSTTQQISLIAHNIFSNC